MAYQRGRCRPACAYPPESHQDAFDGVEVQKTIVSTTVGRIIFNEPIPQDLGYVDRTDPEHAFDHEIGFQVGKKQLGDIIDRCIQKYGFTISAEVA